jgi:hypothetical protein
MTENRFQGQYKKVGASKVSEQDKRLLHQSNSEIKVYLTGGKAAPKGREIREGSGGGRYYVTKKNAPKAPALEGAQKMVRVTGNGVGIVAGIVDQKLVVKSLKNKETSAFIKKVVEAGGSEERPGQFLAAMKEIGKKEDLNVSA